MALICFCLQLEYTKPDSLSISSAGSDAPEAMKIVHKEQDVLSCFCVNEVNEDARFTAVDVSVVNC